MARLKKYIKDAIKCGPVPKLRDWQNLPIPRLTTGERVLRFAADYLCFGEGRDTGKPLILSEWQQAFVLAAFDETGGHIAKASLSVGRRSGKSLVLAVILLAYLIGPCTRQNAVIASSAMTREQASILFRLMNLILSASPKVDGLWRAIPSSKKLYGLRKNVEYRSLSRDAQSNLGVAFLAVVVDEAGSIAASHDDYLSAILSSLGSYEDSKAFFISTQAPSDAAFFSLELDSSERDQPKDTVTHLYTAATDDIKDEKNWWAANPALHDGYRSLDDIRRAAQDAIRIPAKQSGFLLYFMNRRVSMERLWLAPAIWKENSGEPDFDVFRKYGVHVGLDLAEKNDLCCVVAAAKDDEGFIHVFPFAFTPMEGIEERSRRDKNPYDAWARDGILHAVPGRTIDNDWVATFLRIHILDEGIEINTIEFDRWKIAAFRSACERNGVELMGNQWKEVGQGYKDQSVRVEAMETALLQNKIRHGAHPILNLGAASAIAVQDSTGAKKLDKTKAANKVDGIIAMLMSVYPLIAQTEFDLGEDVGWLIG